MCVCMHAQVAQRTYDPSLGREPYVPFHASGSETTKTETAYAATSAAAEPAPLPAAAVEETAPAPVEEPAPAGYEEPAPAGYEEEPKKPSE